MDVLYQVHVADIGWMDWVKNGEVAGTTGSRQMEVIRIKLQNPTPAYDYQGRPYNFFDVGTGSLYLPVLGVDYSADNTNSYDIQTRLRLLYPFIFELESEGPAIAGSLVPFEESSKPYLNSNGLLIVPGIVVQSEAGIQVYDALLQRLETQSNQFIATEIVYRPVPFNMSGVQNCDSLSYNDIGSLLNAYHLHALITSQAEEQIPGYTELNCCVGYYYSQWRLPNNPEWQGDGGAYCFN